MQDIVERDRPDAKLQTAPQVGRTQNLSADVEGL